MKARAGRFDAIAIGASAGGVEALTTILPALSAQTSVAILIVVHLPRERPSLLPAIFTHKCALPVLEAQDKEPIVPGTIYFGPPDYHFLVDEGPQVALSIDELVQFSRPSIDVLFESAADVYRKRLLGIVLTGANRDGAAGLAAIRRAGGTTIVQDPATAKSSAMPAAALELGPADHVLTLDQIADYMRTLDSEGAQ